MYLINRSISNQPKKLCIERNHFECVCEFIQTTPRYVKTKQYSL